MENHEKVSVTFCGEIEMKINDKMLENIPEWMERQDDIPTGWVYIGDDKERYILGQPGKYNLLVFGVNPSTASPGESNLDPTIRKVRKVAEKEGFDGWIMVNLYPLRETDPDKLPDKADKKLVDNNLKVIAAIEKNYAIGMVWAAWGNIIDSQFYLGDNLYDIQEAITDAEWYYRGKLTKAGNPRHPLYLKLEEKFNWFAVGDYAAEWRYSNLNPRF